MNALFQNKKHYPAIVPYKEKPIDFFSIIVYNSIINSLWTKERGMYTDTPKTASSVRSLKMQPELIELLTRYKAWQDNYIATVVDKWEDTDRLFTTWDGKPMHVTSPADYFKEFCKKNDLRYCSPHSWRHLNATLMIESGIDVKTVQACLGHSAATTTLSWQPLKTPLYNSQIV